ncbi:MAG: type II toxin-antitoxin system RelE/ParE family toxin [Devosia sp.]
MSLAKPQHYRLAPKALADLDDIWRHTAETWSIDQADSYIDTLIYAFEIIVSMPTLARERGEFSPRVRIHVHQSHLIIYTIDEDHITVLRLLGGQQNWQAILRAADL